jgi:DNA-binding FrmR family transcriptional regulator
VLTNTPEGYYDSLMIEDIKRRTIHRSKIIQGQMKGLEKMIDQEEYCMDILTQSLAIQKSLASLNKLILENHLKTHVTNDLASGDERRQQSAVQELLNLYELNNIRSK